MRSTLSAIPTPMPARWLWDDRTLRTDSSCRRSASLQGVALSDPCLAAQALDGPGAGCEEARVDDRVAEGIDATHVPSAEAPAGSHVDRQPGPSLGEREMQEGRDGPVVEAVELLGRVGVHRGQPGAAAIEAEQAAPAPPEREQHAGGPALSFLAPRLRPLPERRPGRECRVDFPDVMQREPLGERERVHAPGPAEMVIGF